MFITEVVLSGGGIQGCIIIIIDWRFNILQPLMYDNGVDKIMYDNLNNV